MDGSFAAEKSKVCTSTTRRAGINGAVQAVTMNGANKPVNDAGQNGSATPIALEENVQAIKSWERAILLERTRIEQLSDWIASTVASTSVVLIHVVWFALWVTANVGALPGIEPFDPFPFPFLTLTVSLEAIFLALFVLASQNRLSRQTDKRSHLDLQIDLLAEREMTAVLQLLQDIALHLKVKTSVTADQLRDLANKTDVHGLTDRIEELSRDHSLEVNAIASRSKGRH
jgi:uncharacterized membrane protein